MRSPLVLWDGGQFRQQPGWQVATLAGTTTDKDTWVTLLEDGSPLVIPPDTTWLFDARVVGRNPANSAGLILSGVVTDIGMIGTQQATVIARTNGSMRAQAAFNVLNTALEVQVKGIKDEIVNWVAKIEVTSITG